MGALARRSFSEGGYLSAVALAKADAILHKSIVIVK